MGGAYCRGCGRPVFGGGLQSYCASCVSEGAPRPEADIPLARDYASDPLPLGNRAQRRAMKRQKH